MESQPESHRATAGASSLLNETSAPNGKNKQPGPATGGQWFLQDAQPITVKFVFCPDPSVSWWSQDWAAILFVKCSNVPRLMREGFYWDSANVVDEDGSINGNLPDRRYFRCDERLWEGRRNYFLKDLQEPQRWTALIEVFALRYEMLCRFDLRQLSRERVHCAVALNQLGNQIYQYCRTRPQYCHNAIYNDMPMEGLWPWPRKDAEENRREKRENEDSDYKEREKEEEEEEAEAEDSFRNS